MDYLRRLAAFYWSPRRAASKTLDHSRLAIVAALAIATAIALQAPGFLHRHALSNELQMLAERSMAAQERFQKAADAGKPPTGRDFKAVMADARRTIEISGEVRKASSAPGDFRELGVLAGLFVPAAICLVVLWQGQAVARPSSGASTNRSCCDSIGGGSCGHGQGGLRPDCGGESDGDKLEDPSRQTIWNDGLPNR